MKTIFFVLISFSCSAQFFVSKGAIEYRNDTISVEQGFKMLREVTPKFWMDLYFTSNGVTYYQPGIAIFRRRTYIVKDKDLIRV